jgi:hypothetical protein
MLALHGIATKFTSIIIMSWGALWSSGKVPASCSKGRELESWLGLLALELGKIHLPQFPHSTEV